MPQITVIVPVYKVEEYLPTCVDSILSQTFEDFELILIDDGSPDNCGAICDNYARKDQRIKVIHQENQGLSGARNSGLDIATGAYMTFIDSDDAVTDAYLEKLFELIQKENADIVACQRFEFEDGANIDSYLHNNESRTLYKVLSNKEACIDLYTGGSDFSVNAWAKLFKREVIGSRRFPINRLHEDQAFMPIICYDAKKIVSLSSKMYCYRDRYDSITRERFSLKRYDDLWAIEKCIHYFEERKEDAIVGVARKKRKRLICTYAIYARRDKIPVPEKYCVSTFRALRYLKGNVSDDKYEYYLAQVNPKLAYLFEYEKKIKSILKIKG